MTATSSTSSLASRVLNWLRAGYPEGVPGADRVPLLSLLRSTPLTEEQVKEIVRTHHGKESGALAAGHIGPDEIEAFIKDVTHHDAGPENIHRVAAKLAAAGWPLAGVESDPTGLDRGRIDDEAVPHVRGQHALVGLVDVGRVDHLDLRA